MLKAPGNERKKGGWGLDFFGGPYEKLRDTKNMNNFDNAPSENRTEFSKTRLRAKYASFGLFTELTDFQIVAKQRQKERMKLRGRTSLKEQ